MSFAHLGFILAASKRKPSVSANTAKQQSLHIAENYTAKCSPEK